MSRNAANPYRSRNANRIVRDLAPRQGWRCYLCNRLVVMFNQQGGTLPANAATLDHVTPLTHGGTWRTSNLAVACFACNQAKGDVMPIRTTAQLEALASFIAQMHYAQPLRRIA